MNQLQTLVDGSEDKLTFSSDDFFETVAQISSQIWRETWLLWRDEQLDPRRFTPRWETARPLLDFTTLM